MDTLNLGIKFVKGWQDSTDVETVTAGVSGIFDSSAQTDDMMLFICQMLLRVLLVSVCVFAYVTNKKLCPTNHVSTSLVRVLNFSCFKLLQKICIAIAGLLVCSCIGFGIFGIVAHADVNTSSIISDKSEIEAVFDKDGALTPDPCTISNIGKNKLALKNATVAIADDAKDVKALENSEITITTDDAKTIYTGSPDGIPQVLSNIALNPNASITLIFNFDNIDKDTAIELCDKNVFDISFSAVKYYSVSTDNNGNGTCIADVAEALEDETVTLTVDPSSGYEFASWETQPESLEITKVGASTHTFIMPAESVNVKALFYAPWKPMQVNTAGHGDIDFYPAFSDVSQITGYKFATFDGTNYHEIQNLTSMSGIYSALQPSSGKKTTTLYYQKTSSTAQDLMCYTVKDLSWNYVFGTKIGSGEATAYDQAFIDGCQKDGSGDANGIKTVLLESDGFGSGWKWDPESSVIPKLLNEVKYNNEGFYGCYGGKSGGLLSQNSEYPWGRYAIDNNIALAYCTSSEGWWTDYNRQHEYGVVLARAFN